MERVSYKAKQGVDSLCVRAGGVLQADVVFAGERAALAVPAGSTQL